MALSRRILTGGQTARDAYMEFLAAGDSDYPIELLKGAGVDMSTPEVVDSAMKTFRELIGQLEELVEND